jgi:hypothetical protein
MRPARGAFVENAEVGGGEAGNGLAGLLLDHRDQ